MRRITPNNSSWPCKQRRHWIPKATPWWSVGTGLPCPCGNRHPSADGPPNDPMDSETDSAPTAWKEAGVGMVATYLTPLDPDREEPQRVDVRYAARMPEAKMETLVNGLVNQTDRALQQGSYEHRVVLADGKREIWRTVDGLRVFDGFTRILDFYHAAQHLSKAAEHLFGKPVGKSRSLVSTMAPQTAP